ncbi:MAG: DUF2726 domain-containing protein [Pseudomonadota bacterium]|nr:DUF2726 domain-containing protein [Pseudomonadota bacterium]
MSKKLKKHRIRSVQSAVKDVISSATSSVQSCGGLMMVFEDRLNKAIENSDTQELEELSATSLESFSPHERTGARRCLLLARAHCLNPDSNPRGSDLPATVLPELQEILRELVLSYPDMAHRAEFEWYLNSKRHRPADSLEVFQVLVQALRVTPNPRWMRKLNSRVMWLLSFAHDSEDESGRTNAEKPPRSDLQHAFLDACILVKKHPDVTDEARWLADLLCLDMAWEMAEPDDKSGISALIAALPFPFNEALDQVEMANIRWSHRQVMSPSDWAFYLELSCVELEQLHELLARTSWDSWCNLRSGLLGLAQVLVAVESEAERRDRLFSYGVDIVTCHVLEGSVWFGESITLQTETGPKEIAVGGSDGPSLRNLPSVAKIVEHLAGIAPPQFARAQELKTLSTVLGLFGEFGYAETEEAGLHADKDLPGLDWLCERSIEFELAVARVFTGAEAQTRHAVNAIRRFAQEELLAPDNVTNLWPTTDKLTGKQAIQLQTDLAELARLRPSFDEVLVRVWQGLSTNLFEQLLAAPRNTHAAALGLARHFCDDLQNSSGLFILGYLEHLAGDTEVALRYYLQAIGKGFGEPCEQLVKGATDLLRTSKTTEQCREHIELLGATLAQRPNRVTEFEPLLHIAQDALKRHSSQDEQLVQFEKTALTRWAGISAPARQLLVTLSVIQKFSSFQELGQYAGMDVTWAKKHYDRLVSTGMISATEAGYKINPYIEPLLKRESQHTVVGRIVRAQGGSTAVKQVFNSQREFSIYQILCQLCPNHLVFPNCGLQSIIDYDVLKPLVDPNTFGYFLRASVDLVVVSSTTYLPMLAIEVDSVYHDTDKQLQKDEQKDRIFSLAGIPFLRLRPVGSPSENTIRAEVAEHLNELVRSMRPELPGFEQARTLLQDLSGLKA